MFASSTYLPAMSQTAASETFALVAKFSLTGLMINAAVLWIVPLDMVASFVTSAN